jgi:ribonuclease D
MAVVSISQRLPETLDQLLSVRGVDRRQFKDKRATKLLELVANGKSKKVRVPKDKNNKQLDPSLRPAVALIAAWLAQFAKDSDLDPSLLGTRADIELLLRKDDQSRLSQGWRKAYVGEPIRKLLEGSASLAFVDGRLQMEDR